MPAINVLSDVSIRKAKPADKPRRISDGGGLYLEIHPNGSRYWRLKYRINGREKRLAFGVYPAVSLAAARECRDAAREMLTKGVDPGEARKVERQAGAEQAARDALHAAGKPLPGTFQAVSEDWLEHVHRPAVSAGYARRSQTQLERDILPWIGAMPTRDVTAPVVLDLLRKVATRGALDTAHRVKLTVGAVMRYAIAGGHAERDPTPDLRGALPVPVVRHYAAILDPRRVGQLLCAIDAYEGQPGTKAALQMCALTFQRPGNVRKMQWAHVDLAAAVWTIPADEMKRTKQDKLTGAPHVVPLSRQAVEVLTALQPLTGSGTYCFPGLRTRSRPISDMTLNAAMRRLGFGADEQTAHGLRAVARTLMREHLADIDPEWIEAQLAHGKAGPLGAAYDRSQYLPQRRVMMQRWSDFLDRLRDEAVDAPGAAPG